MTFENHCMKVVPPTYLLSRHETNLKMPKTRSNHNRTTIWTLEFRTSNHIWTFGTQRQIHWKSQTPLIQCNFKNLNNTWFAPSLLYFTFLHLLYIQDYLTLFLTYSLINVMITAWNMQNASIRYQHVRIFSINAFSCCKKYT